MTTSNHENEKQLPGQWNTLPGDSQDQYPRTESRIPPEILKQLPEEIRERLEQGGIRVTTELSASMAMYHGPWPPAVILAEYEQHFPGWGVRMLELTERQVAHRHALETKQVERAEARMDIGQKLSFAVAGISLASATLILTTAPQYWLTSIVALGIVVVGVGGPVVARILATKFRWPGASDKSVEK